MSEISSRNSNLVSKLSATPWCMAVCCCHIPYPCHLSLRGKKYSLVPRPWLPELHFLIKSRVKMHIKSTNRQEWMFNPKRNGFLLAKYGFATLNRATNLKLQVLLILLLPLAAAAAPAVIVGVVVVAVVTVLSYILLVEQCLELHRCFV